ncbi:hypothetical protein [Pantanalinema sp. GBBB05]|uniref:hypothetical protein n=1 Tax=Pantanalinema sp. GBBB05 TaxID=2604139 RepID=UPI001DB3F61C|nr:hypothetical protein [Pantanalinema sp. GBBB05]
MFITIRGQQFEVKQLTTFYLKPLLTFANESIPSFVREAEAARSLLAIAPDIAQLGVRFNYYGDGRVDAAMPLDYHELTPAIGALGQALAEKLGGTIEAEKQAQAAPLLAGLQEESAKLNPAHLVPPVHPKPIKSKKQKRRDRQFAAR